MQEPDIAGNEIFARLAALLDMAGHKNPRMRILELGGPDNQSGAAIWPCLLGRELSVFCRYQSWTAGTLG